MSISLKPRRGTTAEHSTFTGEAGEITVDTTLKTLVVHDGSTVGGFALPTALGAIASLDDVGDVTITANSDGEVLRWNGSAWVNNTLAEVGAAAASHTHAAADITSGTMATARLGSGTADSTTFLRGDQTWATPTASVASLASVGDVTITAIASGEVLKWNGSAWINNTLAEAGIAAASHTHSTTDITDLSSYTGLDARYYTETEADNLLSAKLSLSGGTLTGALVTAAAGIELGHATDTTITRLAAAKVGVEGKAILQHDGSYTSGQVTFSTSDPSGGSSGDVWFKYTA